MADTLTNGGGTGPEMDRSAEVVRDSLEPNSPAQSAGDFFTQKFGDIDELTVRRWSKKHRDNEVLPFDYFIVDPINYDPTDPSTPLPYLPTFDSEVDISYRKDIGQHKHEGVGTTWIEEWRMSDGIRYQVMICEPLKAKTDIPVVKDTALGTQVEGFNEDVANALMQLGYPVVIKGPEIGGKITLAQSAHNTHKILDITDRIGVHRHKVASIEGFSRGTEIGFGTYAMAERNNRNIIFFNGTDGCMAKPITVDKDQIKSLIEDGPQEFLTAVTQLGKLILNPSKAWHYRKTVNVSPKGVVQFKRNSKAVFSGEAGYLARHMPIDAKAVIAFLGRSMQRDETIYREILGSREGVAFKRTDEGGHLAGIDEQILTNITRSFSKLMLQLEANVEPQDLDYSAIHLPQAA